MTKTKKNLLYFLFSLCLCLMAVVTVFGFSDNVYASTSSSAKYTTYGTYSTGGDYSSGCPSNFTIYMYSSSQNGSTGTLYNDTVLNWTYVNIKIEVSTLSNHSSFTMTRNGYSYSNSSLSGNSNQLLYYGALPDGEYEFTYVGSYKKNIFTGTTTYTYKFRFVIDKSAPSYTLKSGTKFVSSGSYVNQQITYSVTDYKTWAIYYKKPGYSSYYTTYNDSYLVAATEANNGWWYFYAEDYYYNTNSVVSLYLDTVAPVGTVKSGSTTIKNGGYANSTFTYSATDSGGLSKMEYKTPNSSSWTTYTSGTSVGTDYGWYFFRAIDKAGNTSEEYSVYYDTSKPSGKVFAGKVEKSSGSYVNADYIKYSASDNNSTIATCYVKMPGSSYYSAYASETQLATEGTYYFYSVDKSGNSSAVLSITLDKTKPTGKIIGGGLVVANGGSSNADYISFYPSDSIGLYASYVKKPGYSDYVPYANGTAFTDEGTYSFYALDNASNKSEIFTATLNRQIPKGQLYVDDEKIGNNTYTNGAHIKFESSVNCYVKQPGSDDFAPYMSGVEYHKPGKYVFYGEDDAKNNTGYFTIIIDRTEKPLTISNVDGGATFGDVVLSWTDGDPDLYAPVKTVTVNEVEYMKNEVIYTIDTGAYCIQCVDAAGNIWESQFVSFKQNIFTRTLQKEYFETYDQVGDVYSFTSYESAYNFAVERENFTVRTYEWLSQSWDGGIAMDTEDSVNAQNGTYYIYKKEGDPTKEVAYFTTARLYSVISEYADESITSYYFWEKSPAPEADGENIYSMFDDKIVLSDSVQIGNNVGWKVDGFDKVGAVFFEEGNHVLTVFDKWNNECDYELHIIRRHTDLYYSITGGAVNPVDFDRTYYLKEPITISILDNYDTFAMFNIYNGQNDLIGSYSLDEECTLSESGYYIIESVNHFGVSRKFLVVISCDSPSIEINQNEADKKLEIVINESEDTVSNLQLIEIYKSTDEGVSWLLVDKDDYNNTVSLDNLKYCFKTSGVYKVIISDEFRTGIDMIMSQKTYAQAIPIGTLEGVENNGYTNGEVTFSWTDEAIVSLVHDGKNIPYRSGSAIKNDGIYSLTFENYDGYKVVYNFVIDTIAPEVYLTGVEENGIVNIDVKVFINEENIASEIIKDELSMGVYESGSTISDSGIYTIKAVDLAGNETAVSFTIDKIVDYNLDVNEMGIANLATLTLNEPIEIIFVKDGVEKEYEIGTLIDSPGVYSITLVDELGNRTKSNFTIVKPKVNRFEYNFDNTPGFERVLVNGVDKRLNYGTLELFADGLYDIDVIANGKTYNIKLTVDSTPPTANILGLDEENISTGPVVIESMSEEGSVTVYYEGDKIEYQLGEEITRVGSYSVSVEDSCGNITEYQFTIKAGFNMSYVWLAAIVALAITGVIVVIILKKRKVL